MKSIKEKSEESSLGYDEVQAPAIGRGFVLGANYVLECFESIIPFVAKKGIIYGKIKETIEQLKK